MQRQSVWGLVVFDWSRDAAAIAHFAPDDRTGLQVVPLYEER
jgi:hypothetical protein